MNNEAIKMHRGQPFKKAEILAVGDVVWCTFYDINHGKSWLEGPYFVLECKHEGKMSEHWTLFSTHEKRHHKARIQDIWVPIIEKIDPPRGYNE